MIAALAALVLSTATAQEGLRVLPAGEIPKDSRLQPPKDLNGYFPFEVPATPEAWAKRAGDLRRRIRVACGIWPEPPRTPLNPVIHGKVERPGFTVEKVFFESLPGHFVTGLLFRPAGKTGKLPAVLSPHGHGGRLQDHGKRITKLIEEGQEKYESGRFPKLARCAQLARMGCVTFIYDMLGYADSVQISHDLAHRFRKQRPGFDTPESWGLYGVQAELRCQSIFGIQAWNSIRALDFLASLPDVDPKRLGVTGGSGGGTQTIILGALDSRHVVGFPQGMVSTAMQGGCTCENASLLRIGTGNVELAGLFAPRPQAMTAANDWTKEMMTKGYPELQELYTMLGKPDHVLCKPYLHFPHNYNYVTRRIMYGWMNRHLRLGLEEPIVEEDFKLLTPEEMEVWSGGHEEPAGGDAYERALTKQLDRMSREALRKMGFEERRKTVSAAFQTIIGRDVPAAGAVDRKKIHKNDHGAWLEFGDLFTVRKHGEQIPVVSFYPKATAWNGTVVLWIDGRGKSGMYGADGNPNAAIGKLLSAGASVMGADLFMQGEFLADGKPVTRTRTVKNPREFAGYTHGYNPSLFAHRVHDILTLISIVRNDEHRPGKVHLVGVHGAGAWAAAARARSGDAVDRLAIDTRGFRFTQLETWRDINFLPGAVKYGDLPGILALSAPHPLWIAGEKEIPGAVREAYATLKAPGNVVLLEKATRDPGLAAAGWLVED